MKLEELYNMKGKQHKKVKRLQEAKKAQWHSYLLVAKKENQKEMEEDQRSQHQVIPRSREEREGWCSRDVLFFGSWHNTVWVNESQELDN